ncbi:MAG: T9SS type A sorting domain-containing protein [Cyclobacteriaceae bacterium]|nr:T9SS type A sorting domain-containing protein [Cyclobacteriaceae bacterium]
MKNLLPLVCLRLYDLSMHTLYFRVQCKTKLLLILALFALHLCHSPNVYAQSGPGGVGNETGTSGQPRNVMWYLPGSMVNTAGNLSQWNDVSGNENNISQPIPAWRPQINSFSTFNYLRFDGTDDRLPINGELLTNTPYTIFMVTGRRANGLAGGGVLMGGSTGSANQNLHPFFNSNTEIRNHHWGNDFNATISPALTAGTENFGVFAFRLNSGNRSMFQNGGHLGNGGSGAQLSSFTDAHLGHRPNGSNFGQIDLAEFIAFQNTLNDAQVLIVSTYLSKKYGLIISPSATDLYTGAAATYLRDLAGIGRLTGAAGGVDGFHDIAGSAGLYLSGAADFMSGEFVMAGHAGGGKGTSTANLSGTVTHRWERDWYIKKTGNPSTTRLAFSMQEGVSGGQFPGDLSNYVLLYRSGTTGDYSIISTGAFLTGSDRISFDVSDADLQDGYYTPGTTNNTNSPITGTGAVTWYSYTGGGNWNDPATWTLDPSGTDYVNPGGNGKPSDNPVSRVVILNGRTVVMDGNNFQNAFLEIEAGAVLDLVITSNHSFGEIRGQGIIRTQNADNFPLFTLATDFQNNGTFEITGAGSSLTGSATTGTFHNLRINLNAETNIFTQLRNITINGNLTIQRGTFRINDDVSTIRLDLTISGNVTIESQGRIRVGQGNTLANNIGGSQPYRIALNDNLSYNNGQTNLPPTIEYYNLYHRVGIFGNFTNNGNVRFTNQDKPNYGAFAGQADLYAQSDAASVAPGAATVAFRGTANTVVTLNGTTDFYQLIVNKGINETHILRLNASQPQFFNLYGPNRLGGVTTGNANMGPMGNYTANASGNVMSMKALCLLNGTLEVAGRTILLSLTNTGGAGNVNSDYYVPATARLWVNSPNAEVYTTIDAQNSGPNYPVRDFVNIANVLPSAYGGTPQNRLPNTAIEGINYDHRGSATALSIIGTVQVSQGILSNRNSAGFIYRASAPSRVIVEGGFVDTSVFRSEDGGSGGSSAFVMTGGKMTVRGNDTANNLFGDVGSGHPLFTVALPQNSFTMSGGTLEVTNASTSGIFLVGSAPSNVNVSGGTVRLVLNNYNNNRSRISSTAPFYNLVLANNTTNNNDNRRFFLEPINDVNGTDFAARPLVILNDLILEGGLTRTTTGNVYSTYLDACGSGNCQNISIGRNLRIEDNTVLDLWSGNANNEGSSTISFTGSNNAHIYVGDITTFNKDFVGYSDPEGGSVDPFLDWEHPFYNLIVNKPSGSLSLQAKSPGIGPNTDNSKLASGGKNIRDWRTNLIKVTNQFRLENGDFNQTDNRNLTFTQPAPLTGTFNISYSLRLYVDEIFLNGNLFNYEEGLSPKNASVRFRSGAGVINLSATSNASIGNVRLNLNGIPGGDTLYLNSNVYIKRMEFRHGKVNLRTHNLKIDILDINFANNAAQVNRAAGTQPVFDNNNIFLSSGNSSDGGLSLKWPRPVNTNYPEYWSNNNAYNQARLLWFPIGPDLSPSNSSLNMGVVFFHDDPEAFTDEGYVNVKIVKGISSLVNNTETSGHLLQVHWRVGFEGFTNLTPTVSHVFGYQDSQTDDGVNGGNEVNYVPGSILSEVPFTRSAQNASNIKTGGDTGVNGQLLGSNPRNVLVFNNSITTIGNSRMVTNNDPAVYNWTGFPGDGFPLVKSIYTAGAEGYFVGAPTVYFSRRTGDNMNWNNTNSWSTVSHTGAPAGNFPKAGDIAILFGNNTAGSGGRHWYNINVDVNVAEIIFRDVAELANQPWRPRLTTPADRTISAGRISGPGELYLTMNNSSTSQVFADLGEFVLNENARMNFRHEGSNNTIINLPANLTAFPRLDFESSGGNRSIRVFQPITINQSWAIGQTAIAIVDHNVVVKRNLQNRDNTTGRVRFGQSGNWTLHVEGDIRMGNPSDGAFDITVLNTNPNTLRHILKVAGDITHNTGVLQLYNGGGANNNATLELTGSENASYTKISGGATSFYKVVMNKANKDFSFTFSNAGTFQLPTTIGTQPLEILNGLLVLDNAAFDISLSDEARGNFHIPNLSNPAASSGSGGLEIRQGTVRLRGNNTGILLDGLLRISGTGVLDMDDTDNNGNNFIEYGSSGNAILEIQDDAIVTIGSQIRGQTANNLGALKYRQSDNSAVIIGKNAAPLSNKAVLEILDNPGSEFSHSGGTLQIARANGGAPTRAALYLRPQSINTNGTGTLVLGDNAIASQVIRVDVLDNDGARILNNVIIEGPASTSVLLSENLGIRGNLSIGDNANLNADGKRIRMRGESYTNNGIYEASGNTFIFEGNTQNISGTGENNFFNVIVDVNAVLSTDQDFLVQNDLSILKGEFELGNWNATINRHLINNGKYTANTGKIILTGAGIPHQISGSGVFGRLELNNASEGATSLTNLAFDQSIELRAGNLKIGDNLLELGENAEIINLDGPFSASKMIRTNVVTSDKGVKKFFPNAFTGSFTFPVGVIRGGDDIYTPMEIAFTSLSGQKAVTLVPVNEAHPSTENAIDNSLSARVLDYYWKVYDNNPAITAEGSLVFTYPQLLVDNASNEVNYIPARLQGTSWSKFPVDDVDESLNTILFSFNNNNLGTDGSTSNLAGSHYTAGLDEDIPDQIAVFRYAAVTGTWDELMNWQRSDDGGLSFGAFGTNIPTGGPSGQIVFVSENSLISALGADTPSNLFAFRKPYQTIFEGGELIIGDTRGNSLGIASIRDGYSGKITVGGSERALLPAGDLSPFFQNPESIIEFTGNISYTLDPRALNVGTLIVSGGGTKILPSGVLNTNRDLVVQTGTELDNSVHNSNINVGRDLLLTGTIRTGSANIQVARNLTFETGSTFQESTGINLSIGGNLRREAGSTVNSTNTNLVMNGNSAQNIQGQAMTFRSLTVNNSAGVTISLATGSNGFTVEQALTITAGRINTTGSDNSSNFRLNGAVSINGSGANRFINGPVQVLNLGTGSAYMVPVGNGSRFGPVHINPSCASQTWTITYRSANPTTAPGLGPSLDPAFLALNPTANISLNEYWIIDGPSCNANITLRWDESSNVGDNELAWEQLVIMRWVQASSHWSPVSSTPSHNFIASTISDQVPFSTNYLTLGSPNADVNPLPVELISFSARYRDSKVILNWATATEINNDGFEIEHSQNGTAFETLGWVPGNGNSKDRIDYHFIHDNPFIGVNYYRLKQYDYDGAFEYSPLVMVNVQPDARGKILVKLWPNPVENGELNLLVEFEEPESHILMEIISLDGQVMHTANLQANRIGFTESKVAGLSLLRQGIYLVRLSTVRGVHVQRIAIK